MPGIYTAVIVRAPNPRCATFGFSVSRLQSSGLRAQTELEQHQGWRDPHSGRRSM